jgi:hypothetical protein
MGHGPRSINDMVPECNVNLIRVVLSNARKRDRTIPLFPRGGASVFTRRMPPIEPKAEVETLSDTDRAKLADLASRNIGITAIATILRKPYRLIAEELDRAGLSRRGVG